MHRGYSRLAPVGCRHIADFDNWMHLASQEKDQVTGMVHRTLRTAYPDSLAGIESRSRVRFGRNQNYLRIGYRGRSLNKLGRRHRTSTVYQRQCRTRIRGFGYRLEHPSNHMLRHSQYIHHRTLEYKTVVRYRACNKFRSVRTLDDLRFRIHRSRIDHRSNMDDRGIQHINCHHLARLRLDN